jgi:hypothetical protein
VTQAHLLYAVLSLLSLLHTLAAQKSPDTMRLDYFHTGNAAQELFSLDRISIEPRVWPGNPEQPIDETNLGKYLFEVRERKSNRLLYSRGFSSIYGEWETTDEAKEINRTFHESLRFPAPDDPVQVILKKRDSKNGFHEVWTTLADPADIYIDRAKQLPPSGLIELEKNGDPQTKVDFLILGDGYTAQELKKFETDARRLLDRLFATEPFKSRRKDFNLWAICPPANESGVSRPSSGIHRSSPLGATYDVFGSERYLLTYDNRAFRRIAQFAPYEFVEIITNTRTYGGGGIFNLYGTVAGDSAQAPYVFVHEFGHHFADLADEYYVSPVAYTTPATRVEPWEPNVTALLDPGALKWKDLLTPGIKVPSPWNKEEYEKHAREFQKRREKLRAEKRPEEEMEALFAELREFEQKHFSSEKLHGQVGAFEGAMYQGNGYYRPQLDCIMFTRSPEFCTVCRAAISRIIDLYTNPAKVARTGNGR